MPPTGFRVRSGASGRLFAGSRAVEVRQGLPDEGVGKERRVFVGRSAVGAFQVDQAEDPALRLAAEDDGASAGAAVQGDLAVRHRVRLVSAGRNRIQGPQKPRGGFPREPRGSGKALFQRLDFDLGEIGGGGAEQRGGRGEQRRAQAAGPLLSGSMRTPMRWPAWPMAAPEAAKPQTTPGTMPMTQSRIVASEMK